ncbi:hypothetical protein BVZ80_00017B, partial [Haemophilus influenzae]
GIYGWA